MWANTPDNENYEKRGIGLFTFSVPCSRKNVLRIEIYNEQRIQ